MVANLSAPSSQSPSTPGRMTVTGTTGASIAGETRLRRKSVVTGVAAAVDAEVGSVLCRDSRPARRRSIGCGEYVWNGSVRTFPSSRRMSADGDGCEKRAGSRRIVALGIPSTHRGQMR